MQTPFDTNIARTMGQRTTARRSAMLGAMRWMLLLLLSIPNLVQAQFQYTARPTLSIDPALQLIIAGGPGTFQTLLSRTRLDGNEAWQVVTNVTLDASGTRLVKLVSANDSSRFYQLFTPEGLVGIPPRTFAMGSELGEHERVVDEVRHTVTLTRGFWMGQHEVTQEEYVSLIGINPSRFTNGVTGIPRETSSEVTNARRHPVERVSWVDATNYCAKLTERDRAAGLLPEGYSYRLPTEAEWEHACRGGTDEAFHFGAAIRQGMANFYPLGEYDAAIGTQYKPSQVILKRTVEVGSYAPNIYGLYDMHGNVWEWCSDWYGTYPTNAVVDPTGPESGDQRVGRGGSWNDKGAICRAAFRSYGEPDERDASVGFRIVLAPNR